MVNFDIDKSLLDLQIAILDDQAVNVKLLTKSLQIAGFTNLIGLTDPRDLEKQYLNRPFDLLLTDIRMPHLDGFQVIEKLKDLSQGQFIPILVLTAQTDQETKEKALSVGANDFLNKPFDNIEVILRVKNMLASRKLYIEQQNFNEKLSLKVEKRTIQLKNTIVDIVKRLGKAAEFRDNETGLHVIRMSKYSRIIANQLGFSEEDAELLEYASAMHDIGKIGIPDSVLLKPDKLDKSEWEKMQTHTIVGAKILANSEHKLLQQAELIALCHHEKYDGTGYPHGLKGSDIPIEARIVPVADVFDALTSARPYKAAWPLKKALNEIQQGSGAHFDPNVVDAFFKSQPEILKVMESYADPVN